MTSAQLDLDARQAEAAALELARKRWPGQGAWVKHVPWMQRAPYSVGVMVTSPTGRNTRRRLGHGETWERAFASADRARRPRRSKPRVRKAPLPQIEMEF